MRKAVTLAIILGAFLLEAAETNTTFLKVLFPNTPTNVATCKVYYGSVQGQLTNVATAPSITITGNANAFGDCNIRVPTANFVPVRIDGLTVGSQFWYGCSVIDTNGVECPIYGVTTCGFTVPTRPPKPTFLTARGTP